MSATATPRLTDGGRAPATDSTIAIVAPGSKPRRPGGAGRRRAGAVVLHVLLILAGGTMLVWGVSEWAGRGFGPLNPSSTMRAMIVAMTLLVTGLQLAMTAFMSSMINVPLLERRIALSPPPDDHMLRRVTDTTEPRR